MDMAKRKSLEAAGFRLGDAAEFLGLSDEERRLVELRLAVSRAVRQLRERQQLTQGQLATRLKSSQSRVAKMEAGSPDVSLDLLFRGLFAVGGELADLAGVKPRRSLEMPRPGPVIAPPPKARSTRKRGTRPAERSA